MNYLRELNAFRQWSLLQRPTTGQVALWHSLMSVANAYDWPEEFTVSSGTLCGLTGMSRQGMEKARQGLVTLALLEYTPRRAPKPGVYRILPLSIRQIVVNKVVNKVVNEEESIGQIVVNSVVNSVVNKVGDSEFLPMLVKDKDLDLNRDKRENAAAVGDFSQIFFEVYKRPPTVSEAQAISHYAADLPPDLVRWDLEQSFKRGKEVAYALSILRRQKKEGILTLADALHEQQQKFQKKVTHESVQRSDTYDAFYALYPDMRGS